MLGRRLFTALVGPTFYRQFVGGSSLHELQACVGQLRCAQVRPMVACPLEEEGEATDVEPSDSATGLYERNGEAILRCLNVTAQLGPGIPLMQLKMSGLLPASVLCRLGSVFESSPSPEKVIGQVANAMERAHHEDQDMGFEPKDRLLLQKGLANLRRICQASRDCGVKTLIDAEHVKINAGIDLLALALMAVFNKEQPLIGHTYQCYLTSTQDRLERHLALAASLGVSFGVKLVRGAYMDSERKRALSAGHPSPVFGTYEETNNNYNRLLRRLMWFVADSERECNLVVASHNEESIQTAISEMRALGLQPDDPRISFGQLLGMYDQTTFPLALGGYNVYKSIPYGPLTELLPYLARRASENRAVLRSPAQERCMLAREIRRRLVPSFGRRSTSSTADGQSGSGSGP
ncbi:unnamed protein product [Ixodes pacificus]